MLVEQVDGVEDLTALQQAGLSKKQAEEMYRYLAIANYEDRFVVPTAHREEAMDDAFGERSGCGFSFGSGCSNGDSETNLFGGKKQNKRDNLKSVQVWER